MGETYGMMDRNDCMCLLSARVHGPHRIFPMNLKGEDIPGFPHPDLISPNGPGL